MNTPNNSNENDMPENEEISAADELIDNVDMPNVEEFVQETATAREDQIKIDALESELATTKDKLLRLAAEMENVRKRATKERQDASKFAISSFAKNLLSVADNLRRAIDAVPEDQDETVKNLMMGIEGTEQELLKSFEKAGIQKIEPMDEPFDPNFHEVMFEIDDPVRPNGTIMQIMEPGYILEGRLLRPARVGISKGGQKDTPSQSSGVHFDQEA